MTIYFNGYYRRGMHFLDVDRIYTNGISAKEALEILNCSEETYFNEVLPVAKALREKAFRNEISFCSITNAKSGACVETCKFCAQSASYKGTQAPVYGLRSVDQMVSAAKEAEGFGATEFSIVTSGRGMSKERELSALEEAIKRIREETSLETCASLGLMKKEDLQRLRNAGMMHYHHNIETSRSYFPNIVSSHTFDEEAETLKVAKEMGFEICCGGILGMGESLEQRVEFAFNLKEIDPNSIPINFLNPRPGTPLADLNDLTPLDCLKAISMMRLVMPQKEIFICGGREVNLKHYQDKMFDAGASGTMLGNYLTTRGDNPENDVAMIRRLGLEVVSPHRKANEMNVM